MLLLAAQHWRRPTWFVAAALVEMVLVELDKLLLLIQNVELSTKNIISMIDQALIQLALQHCRIKGIYLQPKALHPTILILEPQPRGMHGAPASKEWAAFSHWLDIFLALLGL